MKFAVDECCYGIALCVVGSGGELPALPLSGNGDRLSEGHRQRGHPVSPFESQR